MAPSGRSLHVCRSVEGHGSSQHATEDLGMMRTIANLTVAEHDVIGGLGSAVAEVLVDGIPAA